MNHWICSQFSFSSAAVMFFCAVSAIFLLSRRPLPKNAALLSLFFIGMFFSSLGRFIAFTYYAPAGRFGITAEAVFSLAALVILIQAAYTIPGRIKKDEPDIALIISVCAALYVSEVCIYRAYQNPAILAEHGYLPGALPLHFFLLYIALFIWCTMVFIRQTAAFADRTRKKIREGQSRMHTAADTAIFSIKCFFAPQSSIARSARASSAAVLLFAAASITFMPGLIPGRWAATADIGHAVLFTAASVILVFAWINASHDNISLLYSAAGLTASFMLAAVLMSAAAIFEGYTAYYDALKNRNIQLIMPVIESGENIFPLEYDIAFILGTPRSSGFLSSSYTPEYVRNPLTFDDISSIFTAERNDALSRKYAQMKEQYPMFEPLILRRLAAVSVASHKTHYNVRSFLSAGGTGFYRYYFIKEDMLYCIGFEYLTYRKSIHLIALILIAAMLFMTASAAAVSAVFFHLRIEGPIRRLAEAVVTMNDEGKARSRTVEREDEIGFLSHAFNTVLGSLREARSSAANSETQVTARDREISRTKQKAEQLAVKNESSLHALKDSARALSEAHRRITGDAALTAHMQSILLPQQPPNAEGWQIAFAHRSISEVSSDLYDFYLRGRTLDGFALFSVNGHGAAKGLLTLILRTAAFRAFRASQTRRLGTAMEEINQSMINAAKDLPFSASGILVRINGSSIEYANAGHPDIILFTAKKGTAGTPDTKGKSPSGLQLGLSMDDAHYSSSRFSVSRGDIIIAYSPALILRQSKAGKPFDAGTVVDIVSAAAGNSASSTLESVLSAFDEAAGIPEQNGDITVIAAKKL